MSHTIRMLLGCLLPLLLIFVLPLFGIGEGFSLFVFILLMFACHLFMMRGHHDHEQDGGAEHKGDSYEHHQR
jgi:hypothetical protein